MSRFARRPATLLAARRLSDDPRAAWRTVSGLVLAGFVAGFFSVSLIGSDGPQYEGQVALVTANAAEARPAATEAPTLLRRAGVTATVTTGQDDSFGTLLGGNPGLLVHVSGGQDRIDTAVTALTLPLVVLAGGTTAMGVYASYRLNNAFGTTVNASGAVQLAACVVLGSLAMFAAIAASRLLLRGVTAEPTQTAD